MTESGSKYSKEIDQLEQETDVVYDIEGGNVSYTGEENDTEHFTDFVKFLVRERYITKDDVPYIPGHGKIRYLLNDSPVHQDDRDMTRPLKVADGIYLETNHDSESKMRYTKQMIRDFVLE